MPEARASPLPVQERYCQTASSTIQYRLVGRQGKGLRASSALPKELPEHPNPEFQMLRVCEADCKRANSPNRSMVSKEIYIEIRRISRLRWWSPHWVDRRSVDPQPLRNGGERKTALPGRVHYETDTRWNSSRAVSGVRKRFAPQVAAERYRGISSLPRAVHQSLPVRRMFRAPFSVSLGKGSAAPVSATPETRLLDSRALSSVTRVPCLPRRMRGCVQEVKRRERHPALGRGDRFRACNLVERRSAGFRFRLPSRANICSEAP